MRLDGNQHAVRVATDLLNGDPVDDYLVGIDDMMDSDDTTHHMLSVLGLTWLRWGKLIGG